MKVRLTVHGRERDGECFEFVEPGSLVLGRSDKAQCQIAHDPYVSRFHFLLLINPPEVRLRNLSRTNGTLVDGTLYTQEGTTPGAEESQTLVKPAENEHGAEAILHDGSEIEVGYTKILVRIESPAYCVECGRPVSSPAESGATPMCELCRRKRLVNSPVEVRKVRKPLVRDAPPQDSPKAQDKAPGLVRGISVPRREPVGGPKSPAVVPQPPTPVSPPPKQLRPPRAPDARHLIREILEKHRPAQVDLPDIPGHRIERRLRVGGMGMVLQAVRLGDNRTVAMKMIRPDRPPTRENVSRFKREIRITAALNHPHIIPIYDFGEVAGVFWYTMEFVEDGLDVEQHVKQAGGRLSAEESVRIILQALDGLSYAHERGIVHRDLKPANILLPRHDERLAAKLTDFGIAKSLEDSGLNGSILTKPALAMGTLPFMPPEQARDVRTCQPTADVFAMGATLYWMLTGRMIRDFSHIMNDAILQVLSDPPVPLLKRRMNVPHRLATVVDTALGMDPEQRFPDAGALAAAIRVSTA
jgi:serine/threonine-protein kinase